MRQEISTFSYSFDRSYYENFWANRYAAMRNSGEFHYLNDELWQKHNDSLILDGISVDNGVDIKPFVRAVYNGQQRMCLLEIIGDAILEAIGSVFGCSVARAIEDALDDIADFFGTFICTATVETLGTECGREFIDMLKEYRDVEMLTFKEGIDMLRYYRIVGPRIVAAINNDPEKHTMYTYLWNRHIKPLEALIKDGQKGKVLHSYFTLIDEMVKHYDIDMSPRFDKWMETSLETVLLEDYNG